MVQNDVKEWKGRGKARMLKTNGVFLPTLEECAAEILEKMLRCKADRKLPAEELLRHPRWKTIAQKAYGPDPGYAIPAADKDLD